MFLLFSTSVNQVHEIKDNAVYKQLALTLATFVDVSHFKVIVPFFPKCCQYNYA